MPPLPPFREVPYLPVNIAVDRREDGTVYLRNLNPLRPGPAHMAAPLAYWGGADPSRLWLAQRDPEDEMAEGWQRLSYGEGLARVRALAQGLLDLGLGPDAPLMILSRNSIEHALMTYAALAIGAPVCPVTPAHALQSEDFARLRYADELVRPVAFFVEHGPDFQRAVDAIAGHRPVIHSRGAPRCARPIALRALETAPTAAVDLAYDRLTGDMPAKYMLTSGSTGIPKGVILTHGNLAINAKMIRSVWDVERVEAISGQQVMVNFLPWSHCFGANSILHSLTDWGGALYIDWGAPAPGRMEAMMRNLREIAPTQHTTVPAAWSALASALEEDAAMAANFFSRLMVMAYGGAAMGQDIYERIQKVAIATVGERISLSAGYGATETSPTASNVHWPSDVMGLLGLPVPGSEFKLAPVGQKLELRNRGPHITPGYLHDPERTAAAFDEEGYFCLGDAVRFSDPGDPEKGLAFDGRIAEEFKLSNGTWVSCGMVRLAAVSACDGLISDAVVCGLNEADVSLIAFPDLKRCRIRFGEDLCADALTRHPGLHEALRMALTAYNQTAGGVAMRIARVALEASAASLSEGEITEKGYINQGRVREIRAGRVAALYSDQALDDIIVIRER